MDSQELNFGLLRAKSRLLPDEKGGRVSSDQLVMLEQTAFLENWESYNRHRLDSGHWYHTLYKDFMRGKAVLEIGSGLGFDGVFFLQAGAKQWTFCDIAKTNLEVIGRVCEHLSLQGDLVFIDDSFDCFDQIGMYDVIWAYGSLVNVPFALAQAECSRILPHLAPRGRWIEVCFPPERWERWTKPPRSEWTMPWIETYDVGKVKKRLFPAPMEVILDFNFNEDQFKWLDLAFAGDELFTQEYSIVDFDAFPFSPAPVLHGDTSVIESDDKSIEIISPEPTWSYAATFDLAGSTAQMERTSRLANDGFTIEISLRVSRGNIGILLVGDDISTPVVREYMVSARAEARTVMIYVPPRLGGRRLIFRNVAANTRSQFKLDLIRLRFVTVNSINLRKAENVKS
jgi:hypothetical protein